MASRGERGGGWGEAEGGEERGKERTRGGWGGWWGREEGEAEGQRERVEEGPLRPQARCRSVAVCPGSLWSKSLCPAASLRLLHTVHSSITAGDTKWPRCPSWGQSQPGSMPAAQGGAQTLSPVLPGRLVQCGVEGQVSTLAHSGSYQMHDHPQAHQPLSALSPMQP